MLVTMIFSSLASCALAEPVVNRNDMAHRTDIDRTNIVFIADSTFIASSVSVQKTFRLNQGIANKRLNGNLISGNLLGVGKRIESAGLPGIFLAKEFFHKGVMEGVS